MGNSADTNQGRPRLEFYWWETKPGEERGTWWGQLAGGAHRLYVLVEALDSTCQERNIERALTHLVYHVENYLIRAYELRERLLGLLAIVTGQQETVQKLKRPKGRAAALATLRSKPARGLREAERILNLLDDDVHMRNMHTHRQYLSLGLYTGDDIFDPGDALLELENRPKEREEFEEFLRGAIDRMARDYRDRLTTLAQAIWDFLKQVGHKDS